MSFKEKYLAGEIAFAEIENYIEEWNRSDTLDTLATFLGLNEEEEDLWIEESDKALQELLDRQR